MKPRLPMRRMPHPTLPDTFTYFVPGRPSLSATVWKDNDPRGTWLARVDVAVDGAVRTGRTSSHKNDILAFSAAEARLREEDA